MNSKKVKQFLSLIVSLALASSLSLSPVYAEDDDVLSAAIVLPTISLESSNSSMDSGEATGDVEPEAESVDETQASDAESETTQTSDAEAETEAETETETATDMAAETADTAEQQTDAPAEQTESPAETTAPVKATAAPAVAAAAETNAVEQLQSAIDALPSVEDVVEMDSDEADEVYAIVSDLWDVYYDELTEDEQAEVDITNLESLSDYFNGAVMTLAEAATRSETWVDNNTVEITPTYDITLRADASDSDNDSTYTLTSNSTISETAEKLEIYTKTSNPLANGDHDFVGLMRFEIPEVEGKVIKSATLKLVTERKKAGTNTFSLYTIDTDSKWTTSEKITYEDLSDAITSARNNSNKIADSFEPNGNSTITENTNASYNDISAWTNYISIDTSAITSSGNFDFIISADNTSSASQTCFFTKDVNGYTATNTSQYDGTYMYIGGNSGYAVLETELVPVLTIEYKDEATKITLPDSGVRYDFAKSTDSQSTWNGNGGDFRTYSSNNDLDVAVPAVSGTTYCRMTQNTSSVSLAYLIDGDDSTYVNPSGAWDLYIPFDKNVRVEKVVVRAFNRSGSSVDPNQLIIAMIDSNGYTSENLGVNETETKKTVFSSSNWWRTQATPTCEIATGYGTPTHSSTTASVSYTSSSGTYECPVYENVLELSDNGTALEYAGILLDTNNNNYLCITEVEVYGTEVETTTDLNAKENITLENGTTIMNVTATVSDYKSVSATIGGKDPQHSPTVVTDNSDGTITISQKILASQMADKVVFTITNSSGGTTTYETSVKDYAKELLKDGSSASDKEKTVLKAMLDYGSAVQEFANHNTDNLANGGKYYLEISDTELAALKEISKKTDKGTTEATDTNDSSTWSGATLKSMDMNLNYNFNLAMQYSQTIKDVYTVSVTISDEEIDPDDTTITSESTGLDADGTAKYAVVGSNIIIEGITAAQLSKSFVVTLTDENGNTYYKTTLSPLYYARLLVDSDTTTTSGNANTLTSQQIQLGKSLYLYSKAIDDLTDTSSGTEE